ILGVAVGVVGVAAIQSMLVGICFFAIWVPAAGALTLVTFLLAVVHIPPLLLTLPVMAYVFVT
ncbi:AI-2E family transporter, partial [Rhizobium ruizarguesonis]